MRGAQRRVKPAVFQGKLGGVKVPATAGPSGHAARAAGRTLEGAASAGVESRSAAPRETADLRPSGAEGLIEVELREGFRVCGIQGGRLVAIGERVGVEVRILWRGRARWAQRWSGGRQPEVAEDAGQGEAIGEEGERIRISAPQSGQHRGKTS
jgi:hypothetical protein